MKPVAILKRQESLTARILHKTAFARHLAVRVVGGRRPPRPDKF
jgi:hypothetical protein